MVLIKMLDLVNSFYLRDLNKFDPNEIGHPFHLTENLFYDFIMVV